MNKFILPPLYAITSSQLMPGDELCTKTEAALKGGCKLIQYRDKSTNSEQRLSEARALKQLCQRYEATLIINDDVDLALEVNADGVHLGQGDLNIASARHRLGASAIIGITCHDSLTLARTAIENKADYIAFGRFFSSNTKPDAESAPLSLIALAKNEFDTPTVVIGGICRDNAAEIIAAGAESIAISHGIFAADDITQETQHLLSLFTS